MLPEPSQRQVLHIGSSQRVGDGRLHQVRAAGRQFGNRIARIVHHIGVVAGTAIHRVSPGAAVNDVGQAIARQRVRMGRAGDVLEVLDRIACRIAKPAQYRCRSPRKDDRHASPRRGIGHRIKASTAIKDIGTALAFDDIGARYCR